MHESLQPDGRSPRQASGLTSSPQIKPELENFQNGGTSYPSQVKGKRRERGDHCADPVKRERSFRTDDGDSAHYNAESSVKPDVARIMEKGSLVDFEGVENLIQLMKPDQVERKMDLMSRSMLAGVVAATEKYECLDWFVQLKGLPVFDEWLQDIRWGKVGGGNDSKNGEKSVEEFLFVLLRALDKLPVNLSDLQRCNIGRSVNQLTLHKNAEIQRKARSLIDIWKTSLFKFNAGSSVKPDTESIVKPDIPRIMQKGGLVDFEGVDKLIQLMQPDKVERKMDLTSRSMLAGVVVVTEKLECLHRFVQLKGVLIFDHWLQDFHSGKVGCGNDSEDGNKFVEEFLFVVLCALDKLPVNLFALQYCNIGRSVNHLRSHKNAEIQRKARSLVDIWKKRVEAELSSIDTKFGSTQGASVWSSKFHHQEASLGGGRTLSECDAALKSSIAEHSVSKTTSLKPSHGESITKSASSSPGPTKPVSPPASSSSPAGLTSDVPLIRENRSSSSNQSSLGKEDEKSSTLVSAAASKISSSSSHYRKVSGSPGVIGGHKGNSSGNTYGKLTRSTLKSEKDLDGPTNEVSNYKLIVKIPNRVRSPAQGVGGAFHDKTCFVSSLASPTVALDELDQLDKKSKEKSDAHKWNATSGQIVDHKDILTAAGDGAGSPSILPEEEKSVSTEDSSGSTRVPEKNQPKYGKLHETSFSPMNALIESCVKYSEAHSSFSPEDDVGMNLLASVATGEFVSPTNSTERSTLAADEEGDVKKHVVSNKPCDSAIAGFRSPDFMQAGSEKSNREIDTKEKIGDSETNKETQDKQVPSSNSSLDNILNCSSEGTNASMTEEKAGCLSHSDKGKLVVEVASKDLSSNIECKSNVNEGLDKGTDCVRNFTAAVVKSELAERADDEKLQENVTGQRLMSEDGDEVKCSEKVDMDTKSRDRVVESDYSDSMVDNNTDLVGHSIASSCSNTDVMKSQTTDVVEGEKKESAEHISVSKRGFLVHVDHELHINDELRGVEPSETNAGEAKCASAAASSDPDAKVKFDLNEGFMVEDGIYGEPVTLTASGSTNAPMTNILQFALNSIPTPHPASVTVAAAAKGPFLPPDDLLGSKGELGWKGSAATSAFRPAEPRKVVEVSLPSTSMPYALASENGSATLGIDLNIDLNLTEERVIEVMASQGSTLSVGPTTDLLNNRAVLLSGSSGSVLDFDLNIVDESNENGQCSTIRVHNGEGSMVHLKPLGGFPTTDVQRGFDLNDWPGIDDGSAEQLTISQQAKIGIPSQLPSVGHRPNNPGVGCFSSWFSPGNAYSTVPIQSMIPDRANQPFPVIPSVTAQRAFGPASIMPFTPDIYRGSVLSSSPAVSFPSGPFQFSTFPFGPSYPLQFANFPFRATSCVDSSTGARVFMPSVNPQLLGPVGAISSQFQRSYVVGLPDSSRKWGREDLDLNAGPGAIESEVQEMFFPLSSSQHSIGGSHVVVEEQAQMCQASGNILKRAEPEGGLDRDSFRYKQSSWQSEL